MNNKPLSGYGCTYSTCMDCFQAGLAALRMNLIALKYGGVQVVSPAVYSICRGKCLHHVMDFGGNGTL